MISEHRKQYKLNWARTHKESVRASNVKQYNKNKSARIEQSRRYREKNKEKFKVYQRDYAREYYRRNREKLSGRQRKWNKENPELVRAKRTRYRLKHPDRFQAALKAYHVKRKASMRGANVKCRKVGPLIQSWRIEESFVCTYCGLVFPIKILNVDHVIPVSKGGKHSYDNVCPSCPQCNIWKRDKTVEEFRKWVSSNALSTAVDTV